MNDEMTKTRFFKLVTKIKEVEQKKKFKQFKTKFEKIHGKKPTKFTIETFYRGFDYGIKYLKRINKFKTEYFKSEDRDKFLKESEEILWDN